MILTNYCGPINNIFFHKMYQQLVIFNRDSCLELYALIENPQVQHGKSEDAEIHYH